MKTIATFTTPEAAHLLRTRLEFGGISAFVVEDSLIKLDPFFSDAPGGVQVQVEDKDAAEALEFLASDVPPPLGDEAEIACPDCGSTDTVLDDSWHPRAMFQGLLNVPPGMRQHWLCQSCQHTFEPKHEQSAEPPPP